MSGMKRFRTNTGLPLAPDDDVTIYGDLNVTGQVTWDSARQSSASGVWTPILEDSANNPFTMSAQLGNYTRIGNLVFATCQIVWTGKGSAVAGNAVQVDGLPFANGPSSTTATVGTMRLNGWVAPASSYTSCYPRLAGTGSDIIFYRTSNGGAAEVTIKVTELQPSGNVEVSMTYLAA